MRSRRRAEDQSTSGWLYADVMLALLVVFLGATASNKAPPSDTPEVKAVSSTSADGQYGLGDRLEIVVEFNQPVSASGDIQLSLETNNDQRFATLTGVESETRLKFDYVIAQGDSTNDLDYSNQLSLIVGDGVLESLNGSPATLTLPKPGNQGSLGDNSDIKIDTSGRPPSSDCEGNINREPKEFMIVWEKSMGTQKLIDLMNENISEDKNQKVGAILIFGGEANSTREQAKLDALEVWTNLSNEWLNVRSSYRKTLTDQSVEKGTFKISLFLERSCVQK